MTLESSSSRGGQRLDEFTIQLEEEEEDSNHKAQRTLVGKVLSDKSLNRGAIKSILCKAWGDPDGLQVSDVGMNLFMFIFKVQDEVQEVLRKGPWYVMRKLVSLQQWTPHVVMREIVFSKVQFWVQLHGLPVEYMTIRNGEKILSQMGELVEIEDPIQEGQLVRHFIRAKIRINVLLPFSTGCWIPRRNLPKAWVIFKYEKLQNLCFNCGVIGHEQRSCKEEKEVSPFNRDMPRYGARLSVPPAKELSLIMEEKEKWKQRNRESTRGQNWESREEQQGASSSMQGALVAINTVEREPIVEEDEQEGTLSPTV